MSDPRVALPGDEDLDFDVTTNLTNVIVMDGEDGQVDVYVRFAGGVGVWADDDDELHDISDVEEVEMVAGFKPHDGSELAVDRLTIIRRQFALLEEWHKAGDIVRITSAPGRLTTITASNGTRAYFPRP